MSIKYRFYIDGDLITEPDNIRGWDKLFTTVKRDASDLKGLLISQDAELSFVGDMYAFFYNKLFSEGICTEVDVLIQQSFDNEVNWSDLFRGKIAIKDDKLEIVQGVSTAPLTDDSFYARIDKNKNISTVPDAGRSKNDVSITKCPEYDIATFNPSDGTATSPNPTRPGFFLYDFMKYLVEFMSDNEVGFASTFLQTEFLIMITNGYAIRTDSLSSPNWNASFQRILSNIRGARDISFGIEYDVNKKPILRLERSSYFFTNELADTFEDPLKIKCYVDTKSLYSTVKFGSNPIMLQSEDPDVSFPGKIKYNGFMEEQFYILGQCNIDSEFNLVKDIIVDTNVIEHIINQWGLPANVLDATFDENLIFIHCDSVDTNAHTAIPTASNPAGNGTPPLYYNMDLTNDKTGKDYYTTFQGFLASFLNIATNDFQGNIVPFSTALPTPFGTIDIDPIIYNSEIDPGNNFNPATGYYTCPVTGYYTFNFFCSMDVYGAVGLFSFRIVDDSGNILAEDTINNQNNIGAGLSYGVQYGGNISITILRNAGDRVGTSIHYPYFTSHLNANFRLLINTRFSATSTPDSGGIYETYNQANILNLFFEIDYPLKPQRFDAIANLNRDLTNTNQRKKYRIAWTEKQRFYDGYIDTIRYDHKNEEAKIILKSSINIADAYRIKQPSYLFEFDMNAVTDEIWSLTFDSGGQTTTSTILLTQSISKIASDLATSAPPLTWDDVIIERYSIGGALFHYRIIFVNPNFDITVIDISGSAYLSTLIQY